MKTPCEIVDGAFGNTVPIHREGLEKWVANIQHDAFEAGRVAGLSQAKEICDYVDYELVCGMDTASECSTRIGSAIAKTTPPTPNLK